MSLSTPHASGGLVRMDFSANTAVQTVEQSLLKISCLAEMGMLGLGFWV